MFFKYFPVNDFLTNDIDSGVPSATNSPPSSPAPGPRSIIQSAFLIRSKWCSITITVFPYETNLCKTYVIALDT